MDELGKDFVELSLPAPTVVTLNWAICLLVFFYFKWLQCFSRYCYTSQVYFLLLLDFSPSCFRAASIRLGLVSFLAVHFWL